MPCSSDYMEPTERERESIIVCGHLTYLLPAIGREVPDRISKALVSRLYGDIANLDEDTALLCKTLAGLSDGQKDIFLYDGRKRQARRLADWWEDHQEADRNRKPR